MRGLLLSLAALMLIAAPTAMAKNDLVFSQTEIRDSPAGAHEVTVQVSCADDAGAVTGVLGLEAQVFVDGVQQTPVELGNDAERDGNLRSAPGDAAFDLIFDDSAGQAPRDWTGYECNNGVGGTVLTLAFIVYDIPAQIVNNLVYAVLDLALDLVETVMAELRATLP